LTSSVTAKYSIIDLVERMCYKTDVLLFYLNYRTRCHPNTSSYRELGVELEKFNTPMEVRQHAQHTYAR